MKPFLSITLLALCLQVVFSIPAKAQKMIRIATQLKENSEPMTAKRKGGFSAVGKWEFGPYKIVDCEAGWKKGSSKSPIFGSHTSSHYTQEKWYVMVNNADTCTANIRIYEHIETSDYGFFAKTFLNWHETTVDKGEVYYETVFSFSNDTSQWHLGVIAPLPVETEEGTIKRDRTTSFHGVLNHCQTYIEIKEVWLSDDGKEHLFNPVFGYEFVQDNESLAAVQMLPYNRIYVWIRNDLDNSMKFVLANAAAAMLVRGY